MRIIIVDSEGRAWEQQSQSHGRGQGRPMNPLGDLSGMRELVSNFNQRELRDVQRFNLGLLRDLTNPAKW